MGITKDDAKKYPSKIPMYVGSDNSVTPETVDPKTKRRLDVVIPFRKDIPSTSLAFIPDIRAVCPDATHAITRCVESDLRKLADKILGQKEDPSTTNHILNNFECNLTERAVKPPRFKFPVSKQENGKQRCGELFLSGREALTAIASMEKLKEANVHSELFKGVFTDNKILGGGTDENNDSIRVLREIHPELFCKPHPSNPNGPKNLISLYDAAELWRKSLNWVVVLLRGSRDYFKDDSVRDFKLWSETYYHISRALFDTTLGITPYKLKLLLIPQIVESGFIRSPWDHMTEGLEKSNHHSHKNFQTRSMRGGGQFFNPDPMFLELFFSFCSLLRLNKTRSISERIKKCFRAMYGADIQDNNNSFNKICAKKVEEPTLAIGLRKEKNTLFMGLRFYVHGSFGGITSSDGKKITNEILSSFIVDFGGMSLQKSSLETLLARHSDLPHCYVVVKDATELQLATGSQTDQSSVENGSTAPTAKRRRIDDDGPKKIKSTSLVLRQFARGGVKFLSPKFILDCIQESCIKDPKDYEFKAGSEFPRVRVRDIKPLLLQQCNPTDQKYVSPSISVQRYRHKTQLMEKHIESDPESENENEEVVYDVLEDILD